MYMAPSFVALDRSGQVSIHIWKLHTVWSVHSRSSRRIQKVHYN